MELYFSNMEEKIREIARENDKFLFERLDNIEYKYVGYRIKQELPITDGTMIGSYSIKCTMHYQFIGFDDIEEMKHWLEEGYSICEKSDLEKVRGSI